MRSGIATRVMLHKDAPARVPAITVGACVFLTFLMPAAGSAATSVGRDATAVIKDCLRDGILTRAHLYDDLRRAERLPAAVTEYTNCRSRIRLARRQAWFVRRGLRLTAGALRVVVACPGSRRRVTPGVARVVIASPSAKRDVVRARASFVCGRGAPRVSTRISLTARDRSHVGARVCAAVRLRLVLIGRRKTPLAAHTVPTALRGVRRCQR